MGFSPVVNRMVYMEQSDRVVFLKTCIRLFSERGLSFCISRNADEFWLDGESDIDLVILPEQRKLFEMALLEAASLSGYQVVSRTWFECLCLTFYCPGNPIVRIDLDDGFRWRWRNIRSAQYTLRDLREENGLPFPCAVEEAIVLVFKALEAGYLKDVYRDQLQKICADETQKMKLLAELHLPEELLQKISSGHGFIELHQWALQKKVSLAIVLKYALRMFVRIVDPPGIVINTADRDDDAQQQIQRGLGLLFPLAKCVSDDSGFLKILAAMIRGGIYWRSKNSSFISRWLLHLWLRKPSFTVCNHLIKSTTGKTSSIDVARDLISSELVKSKA